MAVAIETAMKPRMVVRTVSWAPAVTSVPTSVIPEIAFAPDISGVCRSGGTFVITS